MFFVVPDCQKERDTECAEDALSSQLKNGTRMTRIRRIFTDENKKISVNPFYQRYQRANP